MAEESPTTTISHEKDVNTSDLPSPIPPPLYVVPSSATNPEAGHLQQHATTGTDAETYPEGGLQAWLVVLGSWLALMASLGVMNTLATFQSYLTAHQLSHYDEGTVGWVFSIYTFVVFFLGLYIGPMFDKYGPRWIIFTGSVLLGASLMLFSISTGNSTPPSVFLGSLPIMNLPRNLLPRILNVREDA